MVSWPSALVTALRDDTGALLVAGFLGDGITTAPSGSGRRATGRTASSFWIEAFLGGAVLQPGERRELHGVVIAEGDGDPSALLEAWAGALGAWPVGLARPRRTRWWWRSWYHYFAGVTEADLRANLARRGGLALRRLPARRRLPSGDRLARLSPTRSSRRRSRDWRLPSRPRVAHPGYGSRRSSPAPTPWWRASTLIRLAVHAASGTPLVGMSNEAWGGAVNTLDTSNPEVLDHLESLAGGWSRPGTPT